MIYTIKIPKLTYIHLIFTTPQHIYQKRLFNTQKKQNKTYNSPLLNVCNFDDESNIMILKNVFIIRTIKFTKL